MSAAQQLGLDQDAEVMLFEKCNKPFGKVALQCLRLTSCFRLHKRIARIGWMSPVHFVPGVFWKTPPCPGAFQGSLCLHAVRQAVQTDATKALLLRLWHGKVAFPQEFCGALQVVFYLSS